MTKRMLIEATHPEETRVVVVDGKRLEEFDLSAGEIARLHGPVGLYLGSKTPPEIALAILAEMTAVRYGVPDVGWAAKEQSRFAASACEVAPAATPST